MPLTIMFWPESAYGPTNQCIGLAAILRDRGHTIVFAAESSWAGKLEPFGFVEELVDLAEPADDAGDADAGKFWTDFIAETAPEFRKPTIEQLASFIQPTYQALIDGAKYCEPRLREIIATHRPDVIVEDNVVLFPALVTSEAPFVRIVSCSPLEVPGPGVPPPFSGLPSAGSSQWDVYRAEFDRTHRDLWVDFDSWVRAQGADGLPELEFMPRANAANLYVYPAEADYLDARPLDDRWTRMDSSVRGTDEEYALPAEVANRPNGVGLVYLSLGSLGGADVELMQRLVDEMKTATERQKRWKWSKKFFSFMGAASKGGALLIPPVAAVASATDAVISLGKFVTQEGAEANRFDRNSNPAASLILDLREKLGIEGK